MYLRYGGYQHALREAGVTTRKEPLRAPDGTQFGVKETWNVRGLLMASDQSSLLAAQASLDAAYAQQFQTAQLVTEGGTVARQMNGQTIIGGVQVISGPSYTEYLGNEYGTYLTYEITLEGTYQVSGAKPLQLLEWHEELAFEGGGPRFVFLQTINGPPVKQLVAQQTPYRVAQQGMARSLLAYVTPPNPLWPAAEHRDRRQIRLKSPERARGGGAPAYTEFEVTWTYQFEGAAPLSGRPTYWL